MTALIGASVDARLDAALLALDRGETELADHTSALQSWWLAGYIVGLQHATANRIARLEWERDLWYFVANNPGKRPGDFYRATTDAMWAEATK